MRLKTCVFLETALSHQRELHFRPPRAVRMGLFGMFFRLVASGFEGFSCFHLFRCFSRNSVLASTRASFLRSRWRPESLRDAALKPCWGPHAHRCVFLPTYVVWGDRRSRLDESVRIGIQERSGGLPLAPPEHPMDDLETQWGTPGCHWGFPGCRNGPPGPNSGSRWNQRVAWELHFGPPGRQLWDSSQSFGDHPAGHTGKDHVQDRSGRKSAEEVSKQKSGSDIRTRGSDTRRGKEFRKIYSEKPRAEPLPG